MPGPLWIAPLVPAALLVATAATAVPALHAASAQLAEALRYE
jgi:ABC-type lipoprotein release transport system permease subunit